MSDKFIKNRLTLIVLISACSVILISMGIRQTFGLFFQVFEENLGVTRTEFGLAIKSLIRYLVSKLSVPSQIIS